MRMLTVDVTGKVPMCACLGLVGFRLWGKTEEVTPVLDHINTNPTNLNR